jgi:predicted DNA-binding protein with PD1-like motif
MESRANGQLHFLRLDRGEDLVRCVTEYCRGAGLHAGSVSGIGALEEVELGYYVLPARAYDRRRLPGVWELLSLAGNVTLLDGAPFLHAHAVLSAPDFTVTGGHLFGGRIAVTGELFIVEAGMPLSRRMDEAIGLRLVTVGKP